MRPANMEGWLHLYHLRLLAACTSTGATSTPLISIFFDNDDTLVEYFSPRYTLGTIGPISADAKTRRQLCTAFSTQLTLPSGNATIRFDAWSALVKPEQAMRPVSNRLNWAPVSGPPAPVAPGVPIYWFKPDTGVAKNGSNQVNLWADQSGNGYDVTNVAAAAHFPVWTPNVFPSGLAALDWGQDTQDINLYRYLERINIAADPGPLKNMGARTILALIKPNHWAADTTRVGGIIVGHPNTSGFTWDGEMMQIASHQETQFDGGFFWQLSGVVDYTNVPIVVALTWPGAGSTTTGAYVNGAARTGAYPGGNILRTGNGGITKLDVGFDSGPAYTGHTFSGFIGEVLCYAGTDPVVLAAGMAYLKARGGL
jgi:hypothetical protein